MKSSRGIRTLIYTILGLALIVSPFFYHAFPAKVPIHWNSNGEVNGYGSAGFAAFFFPVFMIGLYLLLTHIPKIDPHYQNYQHFGRVYEIFKLALITLLFVIYILASLSSLGYELPISLLVQLLVALFIMIVGFMLRHLKNNWFIGIRTPWTLSSEQVWHKTHVFGSKLFIIGGIIGAVASFLPAPLNIVVFILVIAIIALIPVIYSYKVYRSLNHHG